jgi:hypothetical protein
LSWLSFAEVPAATRRSPAKEMPHTWYVTFELQKRGMLSRRRRSPRATKTFATEAEAKNFAREKFNEGLVVFAGTINPQLPRQLVPSGRIPDWLETASTDRGPPDKTST